MTSSIQHKERHTERWGGIGRECYAKSHVTGSFPFLYLIGRMLLFTFLSDLQSPLTLSFVRYLKYKSKKKNKEISKAEIFF